MSTDTKDPPQAPRGRARMQMDTTAAANYLAKCEEEHRVKMARRLAPKKLNVALGDVYPHKGEKK